MKTIFSAILLLLTMVVFRSEAFAGSFSDDGSEVIKMRIQSAQVDCDGYNNSTQCFMVQKGASIGKDNWEMLREPIDGFNYEPGFVYDVTVRIERVENPGPDQSMFRYVLVEVISKQAS